MAKFFVLEAHQDPQSRPHKHVKKSGALALLRMNLAVQIGPNLIQMRPIRQAVENLSQPTPKAIEIPKLLPPRGPEGLLLTYPLPDQRTMYL